MTFDQSELIIEDEILKTAIAQNGSVADMSIAVPAVPASEGHDNSLGAPRTVKGSLRGANIPIITELGKMIQSTVLFFFKSF